MIHTETLIPSIPVLLRGYDDPSLTSLPDTYPLPDWDLTATVNWRPEHQDAEIKGFTRRQGRVTGRDLIDMFEQLALRYNVNEVRWIRKNGKKVRKRRVAPRCWVDVGNVQYISKVS